MYDDERDYDDEATVRADLIREGLAERAADAAPGCPGHEITSGRGLGLIDHCAPGDDCPDAPAPGAASAAA